MKNFKEILSEMEDAAVIAVTESPDLDVVEAVDEDVVEDAVVEVKTKPTPAKVTEAPIASLDPRTIPIQPKARKSDKLIAEALKQVNGTSATLLEALTAQNDTQQQIVEALHDVAATNKMIIEKLDAIANIELPAPIIQVAPPRAVKRDIVREKSGPNKGQILHVIDNYEDEE